MNTPFRSSGPKVALITGGACDIGLQIARELTSQGVVVAIAGICRDLATIPYRLSSTDNLHRAVEELKQMGIDAVGLECDGRSEHHVKSIVAEVIRRFGRVDILVNNAGVISLCPIQDLTEEARTAGTFDIFTIYRARARHLRGADRPRRRLRALRARMAGAADGGRHSQGRRRNHRRPPLSAAGRPQGSAGRS